MFRAKARTESVSPVVRHFCVARQSRPVCDRWSDDPSSSRNERAEGHDGLVPNTPSDDVWSMPVGIGFLDWQHLRLKVILRKRNHFWRRTNDRRYPCIFCLGERLSEVLVCGHYELGGCTDENSAPTVQRCSRTPIRSWHLGQSRQLFTVCGPGFQAVSSCSCNRISVKEAAFVGLAAINPTPFCSAVVFRIRKYQESGFRERARSRIDLWHQSLRL